MVVDTQSGSIHNHIGNWFDNNTEFVGNWAKNELPARGVPGGKAIGLGAKGIFYAIVFVTAITQLQIGAGILNMVISALVWGMAGALAIGLGVGLAYGLKDVLPSLSSRINKHRIQLLSRDRKLGLMGILVL